MKVIPQVRKFMTYQPQVIDSEQSVAQARDFMREHRLRHLPVVGSQGLVGILTDRDIKLVLGFKDADPQRLKVGDACTPSPYMTTPEALLSEVVAHMADKKYGCALVVDNGKLVGIFTETDAYRALSELLETRLKH